MSLLLFPASLAAQSTSDRQWVFFRQSDGLASNDVLSILVHESDVWIGTANGISRYNGRWQSFPTARVTSTAAFAEIEIGRVTALAADATTQKTWATTESGLLLQWQEESGWIVVDALDAAIHALAVIADGVWLGTDRGLLRWQDQGIAQVAALGDAPVITLALVEGVLWVGTQDAITLVTPDLRRFEVLRPITEDGSDEVGALSGVWAQSPNHIWFATTETIFEYFPDTGKILDYTPPFGNTLYEITDISGVRQESIWVASNGGGAAQFRLAGKEIVSMRSWGGASQGGLSANNVRAIASDQDGSIWFATSIGVFRYQPWAFQDIDDHINSLPVFDLLFARDEQLWVATGGEGVQLRADRYRQPITYSPENSGLPGGYVYDLAQDATGRIWALTNGGVAYFDANQWRQPPGLRRLGTTTSGELQSDDHGIWIGTSEGIAYYSFDTDTLTVETFSKGKQVFALQFDTLGRLWMASADGEIWKRWPGGAWEQVQSISPETRLQLPVTAFHAETEPPGSMLASVKGYGIYRHTDVGWQSIEGSRKVSSDRIFTIHSNVPQQSIWIGSETGLAQLDQHGIVTYDSQDGLQTGAIRAIAQDSSGAYWFGGDRGLAYYAPERSKPWVEVASVESDEASRQDDRWQVYAGTPLKITFVYGDLQTAASKLRTFVRVLNNGVAGPWQALAAGTYQTTLDAAGAYAVEYMTRDQALNYSNAHMVTLLATPPPQYTYVPFLGKVESRVFQLLVLFGALAFFGFGYVSFEIIQHRRRVGDAVARGYNPYISGEPVRREDMFFGRHELLQRIVSTLHNNSIMIHGERRIGKTTLLYQLANTLRQIDDREYWFVALYVDLEGTTEASFFHFLMEEIAQHAGALEGLDEAQRQRLDHLSLYTTLAEDYSDRAFSRDLRQIIQMLETVCAELHAGKHVRLILLMDEMDTLSRFDHLVQQQLRRIFMREFAASVGAVVAGIDINKDWERVESPWFNLFNEIAMQPFAHDEAIKLLVEPVRGYYIFEPEALDYILEKSDGRPHRIQQYAMEAVNEMLRHKRRRITVHDVLTAHEIIQWDSQAATRRDGSAPDAPVVMTPSAGAA